MPFTAGWTDWKSGQYDRYVKGPYERATQAERPAGMKELKGLPVTPRAGNHDTLDRLNRGEIVRGPV